MTPREVTTIRIVATACLAAAMNVSPAGAQSPPATDPHVGHSMLGAPAATAGQTAGAPVPPQGEPAMDMSSMQGGRAPANARDPHAYAGGQAFGPLRVELADAHRFGSLLVENLEVVRSGGATSAPYDLQAWYGRTYDRAVLKSEGSIDAGEIAEARTELLWGHALTAFWDTHLGLRYDSGEGPNRSWLAFGVQGLAPYWFEVEATMYLGESGRSALRLDASYELLLTQRLVLQPRIETNLYGKRDPERHLGSGLSDISAALRLRYEIRRELAPYVGIEWVRRYGETEDLVRAAGGDANDTRFFAGLRFWF